MSPSTRRGPRGQRRGQILDAAAELFAERGFAAVNVGDIGAAVGVTGPSIYRHFPTKDAVLIEIVTSVLDIHVAAAQAAVEQLDVAADRALEDLVLRTVQLATDRPAWLRTFLREERRNHPMLASVVGERLQRLTRLWKSVLSATGSELDDISVTRRIRAVTGALAVSGRRLEGAEGLRAALSASLNAMLIASPGTAPTVRLHPVSAATRDGTVAPADEPVDTRIVRAAVELFHADGYDGVTVEQIADAADVAAATIYRRFGTKQAILTDAYDLATIRLLAATDMAASIVTGDRLLAVIGAYAEVAIDERKLIAVTTREGSALADHDRLRLRRHRRRIRSRWITALATARPDQQTATTQALATAAMGLIEQAAQLRPDQHTHRDLAVLAYAFLTHTAPVHVDVDQITNDDTTAGVRR